VWPERKGENSNEWKQTSNPLVYQEREGEKSRVEGYEPVEINFKNNGWGGLEYSHRDNCLLDGTIDHGNWYYAIGSSGAWGGGIPGASSPEYTTELWISPFLR